jgi:hypothetical protein
MSAGRGLMLADEFPLGLPVVVGSYISPAISRHPPRRVMRIQVSARDSA